MSGADSHLTAVSHPNPLGADHSYVSMMFRNWLICLRLSHVGTRPDFHHAWKGNDQLST